MASSQHLTDFVQQLAASQRRLFLHILALVPNPTDAEEVLQETNVVLWSKIDEFEPGTSFEAWARRIAYFEVLAFRKRGTRSKLAFATELIETLAGEATPHEAVQENRRSALASCLQKLSSQDRSLITQRYTRGATVQAIADDLQRPANSIYRSLERIRIALLQCIERTLAQEERA